LNVSQNLLRIRTLQISGSVGGHMNGGGHFRVFHCYGDI
jgi:hypothetical protein